MVLYRISLLPLAEAIWEKESVVLEPWHDNNVEMLRPTEISAGILHKFIEKSHYIGYFPNLEKNWNVFRSEKEEEVTRVEFQDEVLEVRYT